MVHTKSDQNPEKIKKIIKEKENLIIEKTTQERIILETEIEKLTKQIIILKEESQKKPIENELDQFSQNQGEKRKVYDRLLFQDRQIENLRNKLKSVGDDNNNLRLLLQNNEESKYF